MAGVSRWWEGAMEYRAEPFSTSTAAGMRWERRHYWSWSGARDARCPDGQAFSMSEASSGRYMVWGAL